MINDPHEKSLRKKHFRVDCDDLGHETSGVESGRMKRFNTSTRDKSAMLDDKRSKDAMFVALLDELASPEQLSELTASAANLQDRLDQAFADLEVQSDALESRTVRVDGKDVYLTENGSYRTVSGNIVDSSNLPNEMPGSPATWSEYMAVLQRRAQLSSIQAEVIDVLHDRVAEGDVTVVEMRALQAEINAARQLIESDDAIERAPSETIASKPISEISMANLPSM